jgi:hypothetical protein
VIGIAISGKAGAGKNALAIHLADQLLGHGYWPYELGFAEGPKRELFERTGLTKTDPGGREALIDLAHSRRSDDKDYWVNVLSDRVDSLILFGLVPIITDMRYANELLWAGMSGFLAIRVDATRVDRMVALATRGEDPFFCDSEHPSEVELDEGVFDMRCWNPHSGFLSLERIAADVAETFFGQVDVAA